MATVEEQLAELTEQVATLSKRLDELALAVAPKPVTVKVVRSEGGPRSPWTAEELHKLRRQEAQEMNDAQIAAALRRDAERKASRDALYASVTPEPDPTPSTG